VGEGGCRRELLVVLEAGHIQPGAILACRQDTSAMEEEEEDAGK
jgi:hypothetical protein